MDMSSPLDNTLQAGFSLEQAKVTALNGKLRNHENKEDLKKTAREFEGVFFKQLLQEMDKTIDRSSEFMSGGPGEETFRGMLYDKISDMIATRPGGSGFGLAETIYRQMETKLPKEERSSGMTKHNHVKRETP